MNKSILTSVKEKMFSLWSSVYLSVNNITRKGAEEYTRMFFGQNTLINFGGDVHSDI